MKGNIELPKLPNPHSKFNEMTWISSGRMSVARTRALGNIGPKTNPTIAAEMAFSITDCTSKISRFIDKATAGAGSNNKKAYAC